MITLDRSSFLQKALAYGHWDLLQQSDMQFMPRAEFINSLRKEKQPEQWLATLLTASDEADVKIAVLNPSSLYNSFQTLFFSELDVFQRYIDGEELPLLTLESQMRTVLLTKLPENLLQLKPSLFWENWV